MHEASQPQHKLPFRGKAILALFGIIFSIAVLEITLRLGGLIFSSLQEYHNRAAIYKRGAYRIMCLGESSTVVGGRDSYPSQLEEILNQRNIGISFSVINKGLSCIDTPYIIAHLEDNLNEYKPDMVIAMMGINDGGFFSFKEESRISKPLTAKEENHIKYYEGIPEANSALFKKSRLYGFLCILWKQLMDKIRKKDAYEPKADKSAFKFRIIGLEDCYAADSDSAAVEEIYKKAIELNPLDVDSRIKLGEFYRSERKFSEAEQVLKKAIELDPGISNAYLVLVKCYEDQGEYSQAEEILKKAIELNPGNDQIYVNLGSLYSRRVKFDQAERILKKAIELNPGNEQAHDELGKVYREYGLVIHKNNGDFSIAEAMLKKALEVNPRDIMTYLSLARIYIDYGKFSEAKLMLEKTIGLDPKPNDLVYGGLAVLCEEMGKPDLAKKYYNKIDELRLRYYSPVTRRNYQKLKAILDQRRIKLVCIQYPMRSIEPLKRMFAESLGTVIFVDNEKIFKDAIKKTSFKEYFIDMFAGEFGHCTRKGNRLLAENIANVILKECFNR